MCAVFAWQRSRIAPHKASMQSLQQIKCKTKTEENLVVKFLLPIAMLRIEPKP